MATPRTRRQPLACVLITAAAALAAGALTAADIAVVPQARAAGAGDDAQAVAGGSWCARIPPGFGHPPLNPTPLTLQLTQPSVEPVPATDGLIHLPYAAQATNTGAQPADIVSVVPVDPLAGFAPTGRNLITDAQGRSVAGQVKLFATSPDNTVPDDGPGAAAQPVPGFSTRVPGGNSGLMFFDVTYTDPARIPRLLAHAITLAAPDGGPGTPALTNPVPVGCKQLAVLRPPLVGHGWGALSGCCTFALYHRVGTILGFNGALQGSEQFAIDYLQFGPNNACCNGPITALTSWWGYNTPVLAAAPGVVVTVVDGRPDQQPVGTITPLPGEDGPGNRVVEDIGGGRYVGYAHLKPGSIPAWVREGARLGPGDLIGRVGNSGQSEAPHLHFQVMDLPSFFDATGLPFVFDAQLLEGSVSEAEAEVGLLQGTAVPIDRTGAGVRRGQMPARNGVFGYNLSSSQ